MATYYVKTGGNDSNSGLSDALAWATIAKVNTWPFIPGDIVCFNKGNTWSGTTLVPPTFGASGNVITFRDYGVGALPIITSRGTLTGTWNYVSANIYRYYITNLVAGQANHFGTTVWVTRTRVWVGGIEVRKHYNSSVNATERFYYDPDTDYLYLYSTTAPGLTVQISSTIGRTLYVNGRNYLTFYNIDFRGGGGTDWHCIRNYSSNYITYDSCNIGRDTGCYGLTMTDSSYCEIKNCTFDTGDVFYDSWQAENTEDGCLLLDGCNSNLIHHNTFINWGHTTLGISKNYAGTSVANNKFYNNYITAPDIDYGRGLGFGGVPGGSMAGNEVYNNIIYDTPVRSQLEFSYLKFYNNLIDTVRGIWTHVEGELTDGQGIAIQEYDGRRAAYMQLYNNTIANCVHPGIYFIGWESIGISYNQIINNIVANCDTDGSNYQFEGDNYSNVNNNTYRNNLFYSSATTNTVHYRGSVYTSTTFNSADTLGDVIADNKAGNPLFVGGSPYSFKLSSTSSPAWHAGYYVGLVSDIDGEFWYNPPSIGAYEYSVSPILPTVTTTAITSITTTTASSGGNVTSDGGAAVIAKGVCWSIGENPVITDSYTVNGSGTGSFTSSLTGLASGVSYVVRAYATNSVGTAYGSPIIFTTLTTGVLPTVTTTAITGITTISATGGGNVTSIGSAAVTARGVCWSTSTTPTVANSRTTDGSGLGVFTSTLTGLTPSTYYYVRAYATNSVGTSYGVQTGFTTSAVVLATVTTTSITFINPTTATGGGNVTSDGGGTVSSRGVCWSTSTTPTTANSRTIETGGTGAFISYLTGLTGSTFYYVRAYAINQAGTAYGSQVTFTTTAAITLPVVTTTAITDNDTPTASGGGNVTSTGGATVTARGICWSTSIDPTIALSTKTTNGTGLGVFTSILTGLTNGIFYYVRAYATNSVGTAYGNNVTFTSVDVGTTIPISAANLCHFYILEYEDTGYVELTDGVTTIRKGVRAGKFVIDIVLTVTGFAGIENVDWENIKTVE